jgi:hypothetical protein
MMGIERYMAIAVKNQERSDSCDKRQRYSNVSLESQGLQQLVANGRQDDLATHLRPLNDTRLK